MQNDLFEKAPVHKAFFKFTLPVVLGMVVGLVYNMADTYFIARTGSTSLVAGVSLSAPVFILMIALGDIFGLGGSSLISRLFGEQRYADGRRISAFCFYAALLVGLLVTFVMTVLKTPILHLMGADGETYTYARQYYSWIVLGAPFIILSYTPLNVLRTEGFTTASMAGSMIGSVVNIILDPLFIFTLGMGAAGAAIATVIGNICTDVFYVWILAKKSKRLSVSPKGICIKMDELAKILAIGIPGCTTNLMQTLATMLTNRFLLPFGNVKVAAMGIAVKVNMVVALVLVGFAFGTQPLVGYNYGAKNHSRLRQILRFSYGFECALALVLSGTMMAAAPVLIGFFMKDPEIIAAGAGMLRMLQAGMVFMAVVLVTTCAFQSTGKGGGALLLSLSRQGIVFAAVLFLASHAFGYAGVISAQAVSDALTAMLAAAAFLKLLYPEIRR